MVRGFRGRKFRKASTIVAMIRESQPLKKLGENIRNLRKEMNLSQEEFSHLAEIDRSYVGQIERGERNISFSNLYKIAHALKVSVSKLTEGV